MLTYADLNPAKKAFIFELDGVLYPERDFYLQVYYLFAHFIEYVETVPPAGDLLDLMKKVYEHHGSEMVFDRAVEAFGLNTKYRENLYRLEQTAQFPLKLELYPPMLTLLQEMVAQEKSVFLWTKGNPEAQLNKIRQTEWQGVDKHLRVYFDAEYEQEDALQILLREHQLEASSVLMIGQQGKAVAAAASIDFLHADHFMEA